MLKKIAHLWSTDLWKITGTFSFVALAACVPILIPFTEIPDKHLMIKDACGWIILLCMVLSCAQLICSTVHFFLKMQNLRAIAQVIAFFGVWSVAIMFFTLIAVEANAPSPYPQETQRNVEKEDVIHEAKDRLMGPSTLCSYLKIEANDEEEEQTTLQEANNLVELEKNHAAIFEKYLNEAPKWANSANDDTFYSKAGHVVLVAPANSGIPGTVHAAFRSLSAGEQLPKGYHVIAPGDALPPAEDEESEIPDLALDLGGKRYLMLAWRGVSNRDFAFRAINAAIKEIDTELAPLAKEPVETTIHQLIRGKESIKGKETKLLISEPSSQFGIYQAEIFANTGQAGTLMLVIRERETRQPLLIFSQAARFSDNENELFRHDIPLSLHDTEGSRRMGQHAKLFDDKAPYFAIREGESYRYFVVTAEVHFSPAGSIGDHTELLLRRHYNVQAYEKVEEKTLQPTDVFTETPAEQKTDVEPTEIAPI